MKSDLSPGTSSISHSGLVCAKWDPVETTALQEIKKWMSDCKVVCKKKANNIKWFQLHNRLMISVGLSPQSRVAYEKSAITGQYHCTMQVFFSITSSASFVSGGSVPLQQPQIQRQSRCENGLRAPDLRCIVY